MLADMTAVFSDVRFLGATRTGLVEI